VKVSEYADLDATALAGLVRRGEVTPAELAAIAREAVTAVNGQLNALAFPLYDEPLACAPDGPFAGVPFLIKDTGVAAGVAVSVGSRFLDGQVGLADADIMARFRAAGLAAIGCTSVPELAISFATESVRGGITRNPWDLARGTGGSSGGAAALVAARAVPVAHGNDGAGSIRVPAAACGLVGLKPTRGRTPATPAESEGLYGLTYEFALTRSLRDCAALLDATAGPGLGAKYEIAGPARPYARELGEDPGRLRVGVMTAAWSGVPVDPACAQAARDAASVLRKFGHSVAEAVPGVDAGALLRCYTALTTIAVGFELDRAGAEPSEERLEAVSRTALREARAMTGVQAAAGFAEFDVVLRAVCAYFRDYDLLVTPTLGRPAPPHGTLAYNDGRHTMESWLASIFEIGPFTAAFNVSGHPAISLPLAETADHVPLGVQVVARYGREDLLFRVAAQLEQAMPWAGRRPPVDAGALAEGS